MNHVWGDGKAMARGAASGVHSEKRKGKKGKRYRG